MSDTATERPDVVSALQQRALAALAAGDSADALQAGAALAALGEVGEGLYLQGMAQSAAGDDAVAADLLEQAAALLPARADIAYNLGIIRRDLGQAAPAMTLWRRVLALDPAHGDAWACLAAVTEDDGDLAGALVLYEAALKRLPEHRALLYNTADLAFRTGQSDWAAELLARLVGLEPGFAAAWLNYGMALKRLGQFEAAEDCYRRAMALTEGADHALAEFNLANLLLLQGRWAAGFVAYEARLALPEAPKPDFGLPRWTAATPPGPLLLWSDQGYGDTIQFLRYAPALAAQGQRVMLYLRDPLKRLAATAPGIDAVHGLSEVPPGAASELPICSVPAVLGLTDPGLWPGPYLIAPPPPALPFDPGKRYRVGLVWAGNPAHVNDAHRSLALADLAPLLARQDIEWCSLQTGPRAGDLAPDDGIRDLSPLLEDFAATAAVLGACDLLIAVDTAVAHLAGALERPAWVLLPAIETDWRWGAAGETTPWYPSLRLFRQDAPGSWAPVMAAILAALSESLPT